MKNTKAAAETILLPAGINAASVHWLFIGGGVEALGQLRLLLSHTKPQVTVVAPDIHPSLQRLSEANQSVSLLQREFEPADLSGGLVVVIATGNAIVDERIASLAKNAGLLASVPASPSMGNFMIGQGSLPHATQLSSRTSWYQRNSDQPWKNLASKLVFVFLLMVLGHIIISYLPLPSFEESWQGLRPYFDRQFIFFVLSGFLAQLVDGALSMGYGVTSATCLITFGVNPVAMSAAIHTSEIFTTGISGYSHYKFGNVNKKLFRHLVIPGVLGAVLGAVLLVFLGEKYGKWLMPAIAVYAGFLGLKILVKAFRQPEKVKKVRRIGWLAGAGGFLDSFGGGGWGPIVTSNLIAKGRSPKYTIGSVSLTEFFVTLSSAFTFFLTVGVSHWNIVLGLMLGGSIAAPLAARLAGRLPRRAMMIAVGIMVMIWCGRMVVKSL